MTLLRVNGARFFQQQRHVKGRTYGPYWYCKTSKGKTLHLGTSLPANVETAQQAQQRARELQRLLARFVRGETLDNDAYVTLAHIGITVPDDVLSLTRIAHPNWNEDNHG